MPTITVRAGDQTPRDLRHLDGRTYTLHETTPFPAAGSAGTLFGIPGELHETADGLVWEIIPAKPAGLEQTGVGLGDLLTVLIEIRDLLREAPWSAPEAASTGSSSGTGTAHTEPSGGKA